MDKIKLTLVSFIAIMGLATAIVPLSSTLVANAQGVAGEIQKGSDSIGGKDAGMTLEEGIKNVVNVLLFLLGSIAVIMIIIGGIRYATSNGDAGAIKGAKDTILYAVIGLIVAILAYAIVNFVVGAFAK
ncbi:hypothetical protein I8H84_05550 [Candidatus Saccharibacteria bacterium]|nr:hypothetical protein [Candidatus Saccharibacteria bacterium]MBH1973198.1 hypothetical protein [Candidatus Saccharibacteria bacterium]MBH1990561.1 hypothetical protein [Candidatus Saccharibacteria bacterium]